MLLALKFIGYLAALVVVGLVVAELFIRFRPLPLKKVEGQDGPSLDYRDNPLWYAAIREIYNRGVKIKVLFTGKSNIKCKYLYLEEAAKNGLIELFYTDVSPKRDYIVTDRRAVWLESKSGNENVGMYTFGPSRLADHLEGEFKQGLESAYAVPPEKAEKFFSLIRAQAVSEKIINYLAG